MLLYHTTAVSVLALLTPILQTVTDAQTYQVRQALSSREFSTRIKPLIQQGSMLFPVYEQLLSDPSTSGFEVLRIYFILSKVSGDRSRFLEGTLDNLANTDHFVRRSALELLQHIGSAKDTAPIISLLSDSDGTVCIAAAKTLQVIGGPNELRALNTWLAVAKTEVITKERQATHEFCRQKVTKSRDELKARLDKVKAVEEVMAYLQIFAPRCLRFASQVSCISVVPWLGSK